MRLGLLACSLVALAGCTGSRDAPDGTPEILTGTIVAVARDGPEVRSFRLVGNGRRAYEILIADEVDYGFDLTHLEEHRATGDPVLVRVDERDGRLVALSIEDA